MVGVLNAKNYILFLILNFNYYQMDDVRFRRKNKLKLFLVLNIGKAFVPTRKLS